MQGVFCLEGFWHGDHREKISVYPILSLAQQYYELPFIHHRCGTREEFIFSVKRWKAKSFHKKYPLLYLAFHGRNGKIVIGKDEITLIELAELLEDKCEGVIIFFGSCQTMHIDKRQLMNFLNRTKALAIMGYRQEVEWMISASFEILLLYYLQQQPQDSQGIEAVQREVINNCGGLAKKLDFRMLTNGTWHFPRRR